MIDTSLRDKRLAAASDTANLVCVKWQCSLGDARELPIRNVSRSYLEYSLAFEVEACPRLEPFEPKL